MESKDYKKDFKIFENYKVKNNSELVYLDSAASSLTPDIVVDKLVEYYQEYRSNIDRGLYKSAITATSEYYKVREKVAKFVGGDIDDIIFTGGSTASSNLFVNLAEKHLKDYKESAGVDIYEVKNEILVSVYAHHSDLVPLQEYAKRNNLKIKVISPIDGEEYIENFIKNINDKTLIVSHPLVSNVTGEIFDINKIAEAGKKVNAFIVTDATAAAGHIKINVKELDVNALYFSGHKMCGPTGVGVLYINRKFSRTMSPVVFGGGMVWEVEDETSTYRSDIKVFEAGTANIADVIALGAAIDYIESIGLENIHTNILELVKYAQEELIKNFSKKIKLYIAGIKNNAGIVSFDLIGIHPHDVAEVLGREDVAIRAGHHCAQRLMKYYNVPALSRVSFYIYNTKEDVDKLIAGLKKVLEVFKK